MHYRSILLLNVSIILTTILVFTSPFSHAMNPDEKVSEEKRGLKRIFSEVTQETTEDEEEPSLKKSKRNVQTENTPPRSEELTEPNKLKRKFAKIAQMTTEIEEEKPPKKQKTEDGVCSKGASGSELKQIVAMDIDEGIATCGQIQQKDTSEAVPQIKIIPEVATPFNGMEMGEVHSIDTFREYFRRSGLIERPHCILISPYIFDFIKGSACTQLCLLEGNEDKVNRLADISMIAAVNYLTPTRVTESNYLVMAYAMIARKEVLNGRQESFFSLNNPDYVRRLKTFYLIDGLINEVSTDKNLTTSVAERNKIAFPLLLEGRELLPDLIRDNLFFDRDMTIELRNKLKEYESLYQIHMQKLRWDYLSER